MRLALTAIIVFVCIATCVCAFFSGIVPSFAKSMPNSAKVAVDTTTATPAAVETENATSSAAPASVDPAKVASDDALNRRAEQYVREIAQLTADSEGKKTAKKSVQKLLRGRTKESPEFCAAVACRCIQEMPSTEIAAEAEMYRIASRFRQSPIVDVELRQMLDEFTKNYRHSKLPVVTYKWICDQLVYQKQSYAAVNLAKHAVAASRPYRDVKELEAYYRMTRETYSLLNSVGGDGPAPNRRAATSVSPSPQSQLTTAEYQRFVGKSLDFYGPTLEGYSYSPSSLSGNWVVVHFWATWCPSCRKFTPQLRPIYDKWSSSNVKFLGVSLDTDHGALKDFAKENRITWTQLVNTTDESGWQSPLAQNNGVSSIPIVFIVCPDGYVVEAGLRRSVDIEDALTIHVK